MPSMRAMMRCNLSGQPKDRAGCNYNLWVVVPQSGAPRWLIKEFWKPLVLATDSYTIA